mgnify:FL=1
MNILCFLDTLTNKTIKILPLKEQNNYFLFSYLNSLQIELIGALITFPKLKNSSNYLSIINTVNFLDDNTFSNQQCKREVFKIINETLPKVKKEVGDDIGN